MDSVNINVLVDSRDISYVVGMVESAGPGKYELKDKFLVVKEMSMDKKIYKKGDFILMRPSTSVSLIQKCIIKEVADQKEKEELIRKIKLYIDFRGKSNIPEVEFSEDFKWIKVYARIERPTE